MDRSERLLTSLSRGPSDRGAAQWLARCSECSDPWGAVTQSDPGANRLAISNGRTGYNDQKRSPCCPEPAGATPAFWDDWSRSSASRMRFCSSSSSRFWIIICCFLWTRLAHWHCGVAVIYHTHFWSTVCDKLLISESSMNALSNADENACAIVLAIVNISKLQVELRVTYD